VIFICWRELYLLCVPTPIPSQELGDQKFIPLSTLCDMCHLFFLHPPCSLCIVKVRSGGEAVFVIGQAQASAALRYPAVSVLPPVRSPVPAAGWVSCPVLQDELTRSGINQLPSFAGESMAVKGELLFTGPYAG